MTETHPTTKLQLLVFRSASLLLAVGTSAFSVALWLGIMGFGDMVDGTGQGLLQPIDDFSMLLLSLSIWAAPIGFFVLLLTQKFREIGKILLATVSVSFAAMILAARIWGRYHWIVSN